MFDITFNNGKIIDGKRIKNKGDKGTPSIL